ncbi:MAG: glycosyltransferase [Rhodoferax sp.]|nr:glycosyltransferase [Rhodoferax sp.]
MKTPLITAIVSTYNSERFIHGCLEDLVQQTIFKNIEVLIIDSGSQQAEAAICVPFADAHPNIRFVRTEREPLYATWNRAIAMAKGKYLTNANVDDRHRCDAFERLADELDRAPEIALAYADHLISHTENETYNDCLTRAAQRRYWPPYTSDDLMLRCITGSQPMWRRSMHEQHGLFDTRYRIAADYELWMRFAQTGQFRHVAEPLGVFYDSPTTLSGANNRWQLDTETLNIKLAYLPKPPWCHSNNLRPSVAKALFSTGYWYIEHAKNPSKAKPFLKAAWKLDPFNPSLAKTYFLRGVLGSTTRLG